MTSPLFSVLPGHDLAYNELVKPTRRWAFSYYFLHRWLPLLHPQQAMLIQVLRQCTWQQGRPTGRCQLANATLCRLLGWSESSHKTLLAELERPLTAWFVRRERTRKRHVTEGHAVEGAPRYQLVMDEPLTPRDQAALRTLLAAEQPPTPYAAAERLAALAAQRTRDLWKQLDEQRVTGPLPQRPATVAEIARAAWPHLSPEALATSQPFAESAERCQLRLTGAGYAHMELDYLLQSWLPHLGINNTWLVIVLRARCFHDPHTGETRDTVTLSRQALEAQLGIPSRTFRRLLRDELTLGLFHISPADEPARPTEPRCLPHRGELCFHLAYPLLPICPTDQGRYATLLVGTSNEEEFSTPGPATRLNPANPPGCSPAVIPHQPANPAEPGQSARLSDLEAASRPGWKRPADPAQGERGGQPTRLKAASQPDIPKTQQSKELFANEPPTPHHPREGGGEREQREEIRRLLEPFRIQGLPRILQNQGLSVAEVRGWILRGEAEVEPAQMAGFLFRRLQARGESEPLPECYLRAGQVSPAEAEQFERWWLAELAPPPFASKDQRGRYAAWLQIVKGEAGDPERPDFSPHACWRREMARCRMG